MSKHKMNASAAVTEHWPWLSIFGLIGGFAGALTFGWRVFDYLRSYIKLELTAEETESGNIKLRTTIENPNISAKYLNGVFVIVGPEMESPAETINYLFQNRSDNFTFSNYNEMVHRISKLIQRNFGKIADEHGRALVPLPYYYRENIGVGDEILSFETILLRGDYPPGLYSARLYLDGRERYHRVVQAAFDTTAGALPASSTENPSQ